MEAGYPMSKKKAQTYKEELKLQALPLGSITPERRRHTTTTQKDPTNPRETKIILRRKMMETPAAQPHQCNSEPDHCSCTGQHLHLVGTFLMRNSNCWVMDRLPWWVSPLCYGDFLTNRNPSLLSWYKKKPSMGQGHRVIFNVKILLVDSNLPEVDSILSCGWKEG